MANEKNALVTAAPVKRHTNHRGGGFYNTTVPGLKGVKAAQERPSSNQQLAEMKEQLGMLDKMAISRRARTEVRRVVAEIVINALEKQKQLILFQATLELADEKKRLFAESLREAAQVEKEIAERSTEHESQLIDFVVDTALEGQKKKEERLKLLDEQVAAGRITQDTYLQEADRVRRWSMIFLDNIDAKIELILRNHAQLIEKALTLFNERTIPGAVL